MTAIHLRTAALLLLMSVPASAAAQSLGTFRWQLQPHCNIVTLAVTQNGGVFEVEGTDDQCGAGQAASAIGTAFFNPDGSIGFGLAIVTAPSGTAVHVDASITLSTLGGTWRDSAGGSGLFVFTPGAGIGGSPRPPRANDLAPGTVGAAAIDPAQVQVRVDGACPVEQVMRAINQNGSVTCVARDGTTLSIAFGGGLDANDQPGSFVLKLATTPTNAFDLTNRFGFVSSATGTPATTPPPLSGPGTRLLWHPGKSAFRVGQVNGTQWDQANIGFGSVAMGLQTVAKGDAAFAMGTRASAEGTGSVALGSDVSASTNGTFMFGDRSTTTPMLTFEANQFLVRAAGGYGLYTNAALTAGVEMPTGESAWSSVSDANMKEYFRDLDGDDVLSKIARMPIQEWSYKAQNAEIRHVGPTAQDFHAAFGLGVDQLRISTIDADGIALRAIQALEARTRRANETLLRENETLRSELAAVRARLERIDRLLREQR